VHGTAIGRALRQQCELIHHAEFMTVPGILHSGNNVRHELNGHNFIISRTFGNTFRFRSHHEKLTAFRRPGIGANRSLAE
jgi:hypothetical protein